MMMCLESNRSDGRHRRRRHDNAVVAAAVPDWRKWQTFDTSLFMFLVFPHPRDALVQRAQSHVSFSLFGHVRTCFIFSPLPFSRLMITTGLEEIGAASFSLFSFFFSQESVRLCARFSF